jgi:riboflavin kinase/FMN adenylyltransferase
MDHYTTLDAIPAAAQNAVLVIGNFDGVHRGHRALLDHARALARAKSLRLNVLTFTPHPRSLFRPDDPPFRLTDDAIKHELLSAADIDALITLNFDWDFASQSAEDFMAHVLKESLAPAMIVVGADFCFGQLRRGNVESLREAGFDVAVMDKVSDALGPLSSSAIREALRIGDLDRAGHILGRPWEMRGVVQSGDRRGRELGYPTANVPLGTFLHPSYGVYAARVRILEDGVDAPWWMAATNIGIRPMFQLSVGQIEAHILDFDRDIYGKTLAVQLIQKLRGEAKFDSLEALIDQIGRDCVTVREILTASHN